MNRLTEHQESMSNIDEMSADLRSMGFTDTEISSAYDWLLKHIEDSPDSFSLPGNSISKRAVRVLSTLEREIVSAEAFGYLLQLRQLNLLTAEQMEMILDRCSLFVNDPIGLNEMKILASVALFDNGATDFPYAVWVGDPENEPVN
jgi:uncharacterized protein Smg (DUF494 family)